MEIIAAGCASGTGHEDRTLKDGLRVADLDAFLAGVERRAFRIAQVATRDRDEALDIVQDAMLQLARRYARRPAAEWPPLFHRILDNKIRDWQRRQSVRRRLFRMPAEDIDEAHEDTLESLADPAQPEAVQRLGQQQALAVLDGAIRALPLRQRQAFVLRVWEGLSVEHAAAAMGCSDGSVKTHLSRALSALRARLDGVWP
jgi:RNA polymerase sigma-70 factor (ECF subfamily)